MSAISDTDATRKSKVRAILDEPWGNDHEGYQIVDAEARSDRNNRARAPSPFLPHSSWVAASHQPFGGWRTSTQRFSTLLLTTGFGQAEFIVETIYD